MADYGMHEDCYPPNGCGPNCPYNEKPRKAARKAVVGRAKEAVNHPDHYGSKDDPYEVIKVIRAWKLDFELGNAVKYIARAGKKDPSKHVEDLHKAIQYIEFEIEQLS